MIEINDKVKIFSKSQTSAGSAKGSSWIDSKYPNGVGYVTATGSDWIKVATKKGGEGNYFAYPDVEKINGVMAKVSNLFTRLMDGKIKLLVERGFMTPDLQMTDKAKQVLEEEAFMAGMDKLAEIAQKEKDAEDEE